MHIWSDQLICRLTKIGMPSICAIDVMRRLKWEKPIKKMQHTDALKSKAIKQVVDNGRCYGQAVWVRRAFLKAQWDAFNLFSPRRVLKVHCSGHHDWAFQPGCWLCMRWLGTPKKFIFLRFSWLEQFANRASKGFATTHGDPSYKHGWRLYTDHQQGPVILQKIHVCDGSTLLSVHRGYLTQWCHGFRVAWRKCFFVGF